jgi:hypothetical protein
MVFPVTTQTTADADEAPYPWEGDKEMEDKLSTAGWRYAIMIGITDPYDGLGDHVPAETREKLSSAVRDRDRAKYPHFMHFDHKRNLVIWDEKEATTFVQELTGYYRRTCAAWLDYDWNDGGEKIHAPA